MNKFGFDRRMVAGNQKNVHRKLDLDFLGLGHDC
jgi:hypothetical protein